MKEGRRVQRAKRCDYNDQNEHSGPNSKVYNNDSPSSQKFRHK